MISFVRSIGIKFLISHFKDARLTFLPGLKAVSMLSFQERNTKLNRVHFLGSHLHSPNECKRVFKDAKLLFAYKRKHLVTYSKLISGDY